MLTIIRNLFKSPKLRRLESDIKTIDDLIVILERRYGKKYKDTIFRLGEVKDNLRWKINQITGGENE